MYSVCGSLLMNSLSWCSDNYDKNIIKFDPSGLHMAQRNISALSISQNICSRFHFQVKCCITVSHLLLCTTNTSTGYCYFLFLYFRYLYTYLTNVLKKCYFAFKSSSGFVARVRCVCACFCCWLRTELSRVTATMMLNSGLQSALTKLILYI